MVVSVRHGKSGDNGERPSLLRRKVSQFAGDDVDHGTCEKGNNDVARQFLAWGGNWGYLCHDPILLPVENTNTSFFKLGHYPKVGRNSSRRDELVYPS
jgi:hypothetical protein